MEGDIHEAIRNPKRAIKYLSELRWRAKLYTHFREIFAEETYLWLNEKIRPGTTLIDIGAFVGDSAIYFSMNPKVKKVMAYEPMPGTYLQGREILDLRKNKKIFYKNQAIGAENTTISLPEGKQGGIAAATTLNRKGRAQIKMITLDEAVKGQQRIAIKCDVEGDEFQIFNAKPKSIFKNVYAIIMEIHTSKMGQHNFHKLISAMKSYGFRPYELEKSTNVSLYGFYKE